MNIYRLQGATTAYVSQFFAKLGFKNVKDKKSFADRIELNMKDGSQAEIRFLEPTKKGIYWSVEDFKLRAETLAEDEDWREKFDESKFLNSLETMIRKHDCNIGITWETIDYYLTEYCIKDGKK